MLVNVSGFRKYPPFARPKIPSFVIIFNHKIIDALLGFKEKRSHDSIAFLDVDNSIPFQE